MALAQILSAVRQLIFDEHPPVDDVSARRAWLHERFSDLSETEIADLAAIPPERLRVYSDLVFAGERSVLRWAFPMTFAAIDRLRSLGGHAGNEFEFEMIHDLHRFRSWQSASTRELATIFDAYVREKLGGAGWDGLAEMTDYERTDLDVFYAVDDEHRPMTGDDIAGLAGLSVGDLMNVPVALATYASLREYEFDILGIAEQWKIDKSLPDPLPERGLCLAVCGRNGDSLMPQWVSLSQAGYTMLGQLQPGLVVRVNDVANSYLASLEADDGRSEEELFAAFFGELAEWFQAGVLLRVS